MSHIHQQLALSAQQVREASDGDGELTQFRRRQMIMGYLDVYDDDEFEDPMQAQQAASLLAKRVTAQSSLLL